MNKEKIILTAHQPVYLPWLGLFHKISLADIFVYFDDVQYQTKDWNNRNKIKTNQGDIWLTVPVLNKDHYQLKLKDVMINNELPWARKHFKSIYLTHKKAKYFDKYIGFFEDTYNKKWDKLSDLNEHLLKNIMKFLGIEVKFFKLSEYGFTSSKSELVLEMCQKMGADLYIFGIQGKNYADLEAFKKAGINVYFQDYQHPVYDQLHGKEFSPFLSIIDLLFNHGEDSLRIVQSGNITKGELLKSIV
ncbi:MAG: WbqC family protein [Candidatus Margulisbacteria bacterium]|nr:WbqC family protein [Candidatus Margulisiibacteriota bacterium]MBU1617120.1 WbqC family protein [Candidatus Margulisiibacteriota bacterium]